jgi:hypothetical protein
LADFTTDRVVRAMDRKTSYLNALTALTPHSIKIPIHFETDREAIAEALASLGLQDWTGARILRIRDTLNLTEVAVSERCLEEIRDRTDLRVESVPEEFQFDPGGNLV